MRFLPVFLDLLAGPVVLVGEGELAQAKLRLLLAAHARVRWFATDGQHDLSRIDAALAARVERADGDPLTAELVSPTSHGALVLNADGSFIYEGAVGFRFEEATVVVVVVVVVVVAAAVVVVVVAGMPSSRANASLGVIA